MNEIPSEIPHPLDVADDVDPDDLPRRKAFEGTRAYKPLLKPSVYTAIGSAPVVVLASVASSNAPLNSTFANIADLVFRASTTVLLIACGLILVAYRIPYFQNLGVAGRMPGSISVSARPRLHVLTWLVFANMLGLVVFWVGIGILSWSAGTIFLWLIASSLFVFCGLWVTMIIWHTGVLRAYATGALTALVLQLPPATLGTLFFYAGPQFPGPSALTPVGVGTGMMMTTSVVTGLACAIYVVILNAMRGNTATPQPPIVAHEVRPGGSR